ncbi:predicted protein [Plenodomus lingam JN3]|uniref:Predicted protein n=1 Tax=Leptosphaeria maculans (strain JN3 / isolate v23.1.3 / race Av1-4-5-6-7-8) TaxID=985895 RepID=E5AFM7_LEPMJ|nr:predicted protein [Plenodomus lingam JN3]CBY02016.1 predicted protein [Plenodomus lingam JN3]
MFVFVFVYINTRGSCKTSTSHTGTIESARGSSTGGSIDSDHTWIPVPGAMHLLT